MQFHSFNSFGHIFAAKEPGMPLLENKHARFHSDGCSVAYYIDWKPIKAQQALQLKKSVHFTVVYTCMLTDFYNMLAVAQSKICNTKIRPTDLFLALQKVLFSRVVYSWLWKRAGFWCRDVDADLERLRELHCCCRCSEWPPLTVGL